jgi:hypothetical protein
MANKLIQVVKKALAAKYGYKNVSVTNGSGTAWGWVCAKINTGKLPTQRMFTDEERKIVNEIHAEAEKIAHKAVSDAGLKFYTYCSDDGYGTENSEFNLTIN